jgi:hypothetical protein
MFVCWMYSVTQKISRQNIGVRESTCTTCDSVNPYFGVWLRVQGLTRSFRRPEIWALGSGLKRTRIGAIFKRSIWKRSYNPENFKLPIYKMKLSAGLPNLVRLSLSTVLDWLIRLDIKTRHFSPQHWLKLYTQSEYWIKLWGRFHRGGIIQGVHLYTMNPSKPARKSMWGWNYHTRIIPLLSSMKPPIGKYAGGNTKLDFPCIVVDSTHRYLMTRLSLQIVYLWRHVSSTAPPLILWWSNLEILFGRLHHSSPPS